MRTMIAIALAAVLVSLTAGRSPVVAQQRGKQALQTCTLKISGMT